MGDELVVVDDEHDVAHRLSEDAARVWRACDGRRDVGEIARAVERSEAEVATVVARLRALGLVEDDTLQTRRAMLRMAVAVGAGLPLVTSIVLPTPAQAFDSKPVVDEPEAKMAEETPQVQSDTLAASDEGVPAHKPAKRKRGHDRHRKPHRSRRHRRRHQRSGIRVRGAHHVFGGGGAAAGGSGVAAAHGASAGALGSGRLPFTGLPIVRTALAGAALVASGLAMRLGLRRT